jgi:hypothetical protein
MTSPQPVTGERYPDECLSGYDDDGTMPESLDDLRAVVIGHRIISVDAGTAEVILTLDNGKRVRLMDTDDCCAYTEVESFLLHADRIEHAITGVGTTGDFTTWHLFADAGDVMEMKVGWSSGNPFYYGYGFRIAVEDI